MTRRPHRLLGAILAGGQARRFGSDKAHARYEGARLIDRVATALGAQCAGLVVCGREEPGFRCIPDWPEPGLGPLGGLAAALRHAGAQGFAEVLSAGVDVPDLPHDIASLLAGEGAAIVEAQPVVGLWPVAAGPVLEAFLAGGGRSLYRFADHVGARRVALSRTLMNVNRPEDLNPPRCD
ncbi:molybdenum cofactor guanylyltransferase [Erythrobacter sp. NE805]|uniref:molybdenum cofactor guanylyltransferase n=1 Tax=Erythrobacter sp. NE805 TaxID=3389875 RepID=UPI00396B1AB4